MSTRSMSAIHASASPVRSTPATNSAQVGRMTTRSMTARSVANANADANAESRPASSRSERIEKIDNSIEMFIRNNVDIRSIVREILCKELKMCAENRWLDCSGEARFEIKYAKLEYDYKYVIDKIANDIMRTSPISTIYNIITEPVHDLLFITQLHAITQYLHYRD